MTAAPRRIEVVIDELVLHGFDRSQREEIAAALRTELATVLAGWSPAAGTGTDRLDAGSFTIPAAASPTVVGRGLAYQIRRALPGEIAGTASQPGPSRPGPAEGGR